MSDKRVLVIDGGIRRHGALIAAAAAAIACAGPMVHIPTRPAEDDEPQLSPRAARRLAEQKRELARERAGRERRYAEMNERLLRERIAKGEDNRADKYLHAAARRRREAERASLSPSTVEAGE